jgi:sterol desaturase/sphingolipid hydroxylase (fatty acid hydroxylase superfamily)
MKNTIAVATVALLMFIVELYQSGRHWAQVTGWWYRAALLNGIQVASVFGAGVLWDRVMEGRGMWNLSGIATSIQVIVGYITVTFIYYWLHRVRHGIPFLWRWFHQVHHSPQRIEIITSFYKHPIEIIGNGILSSAILYLLCGVMPEAASITVLITGLAELFYHWNVKTPLLDRLPPQRPESHCVHHHRQKFADLPFWDILFGTFHNPKKWENVCGFEDDRERGLGPMLVGKNVTE